MLNLEHHWQKSESEGNPDVTKFHQNDHQFQFQSKQTLAALDKEHKKLMNPQSLFYSRVKVDKMVNLNGMLHLSLCKRRTQLTFSGTHQFTSQKLVIFVTEWRYLGLSCRSRGQRGRASLQYELREHSSRRITHVRLC